MCIRDRTGAGQWGTALSMACSYLGLDCQVYMVKVSYEQKPFRREVMRTYGAAVTPSPSDTTSVGRAILKEHPGTTGSLGLSLIHILWFDKVLRDNGFFQKLEEMGIQDGDIVSLYDFEFEYQR